MAKGTSSGDVHFSVPEGADPLGIGVLDLGRSSYDPIDTIRRFNETRRQNRLIKQDRQREDYQNFMKNMPTVDGVNKSIASNLNADILEMSKLFKQQQSLGVFGGLAKTPEGEAATVKLSQLENKVATDAPIYQHYSDQYTKDLAVIRNGANKDKIDWEMTNANVEAMRGAKNVEEFAQPFAENAGSLVVFRPKPSDLAGFIKESIDTWAGGEDTEVISSAFDPNTLKWKTETLTTKDQDRLARAIMLGYNNANEDDPNKREIDRKYALAPQSEKLDENGVVMDAGMWYAIKNVPEWGRKTTEKLTTIDEPAEKVAAPGYGMARDDQGKLDIAKNTSTIRMGTPVGTETTSVRRTKRSGKKVYNEPKATEETRNVDYSTVSIPLTGFDKTFQVYSHGSAIDTETGKPLDKAKSSSHKAVRLDFIPVWRGAEKIIETETTDESGNITKETWTLKPGDKIPMHIQEQLQDENENFNYEPFLLSSSIYGASIEEKALAAGLSWEEYVSRHGKTVITPWEKTNRELLVKMKASKVDPTELENLIKEVNQRLNGIDDMFK